MVHTYILESLIKKKIKNSIHHLQATYFGLWNSNLNSTMRMFISSKQTTYIYTYEMNASAENAVIHQCLCNQTYLCIYTRSSNSADLGNSTFLYQCEKIST